eukprot:4855116-Pyramimonas_sp.AAC.3
MGVVVVAVVGLLWRFHGLALPLEGESLQEESGGLERQGFRFGARQTRWGMVVHLGTPHAGDDKFCWLCTADKSGNPWNDFANASGNPNHWSKHERGFVPNHPLFTTWGVSIHCLAIDVMHTVDLGVAGHAVANLLYELIYEELGGRVSDRVRIVWTRIQEIYGELGLPHRLSNFRLSMFVKDPDSPHSDYPVLSHSIKAAEAKSLARVCFVLSKEFQAKAPAGGDTRLRTRTLMFKNLIRFYDVVSDAGQFLTANECARLKAAVDGFLVTYQSLAQKAYASAKFKYSLVNKHHMFFHVAAQTPLNPRWVWCYQPEDWQRFITRCGAACAVGSSIYSVPLKLCQRVRLGRHNSDWRRSHFP